MAAGKHSVARMERLPCTNTGSNGSTLRHNLSQRARFAKHSPYASTTGWLGRVVQSNKVYPPRGGALGFYNIGRAADKRYSLGHMSQNGGTMEVDPNLQKLKYATEWQIEIGKVLQSFDPVLRPLEDMAKHGITLAIVLLGISASVVGGLTSGRIGVSCNYLLVLGAWFGFIVTTVAGSIQLHKISNFRETIRIFCHVLLGKEASSDDRQNALDAMKTPQKTALLVEYWSLGIGITLLVAWAVVQAIGR